MSNQDKKPVRIGAKTTQIYNSLLTVTLNGLPYVGPALVEGLNFNANVKRARFQHFIEGLANFLTSNKEKDIDLEHIQSPDFVEFFESVITKVIDTKSGEKLNLFKKILIQNMIGQRSIEDHTEPFLKLISSLTTRQFEILRDLDHQHKQGLESLKDEEQKQKSAEAFRSMQLEMYDFSVQDLVGKGLLSVMKASNHYYLEFVHLTPLGQKFMEFVHQAENLTA